MADFFARDCSIAVGVYDPKVPRLRQPAYVTVKGGSVTLGANADKNFDQVYSGDRRAIPSLESVSVTLEGKAGSLRRCAFSFTCYDTTSFNTHEKAILLPGQTVTIKFGYVASGLTNATSGNYTFTIYDYTFSITKEGYYKCSAKGVGKGMTFEEDNLNAEGLWPSEEFVTSYAGFNKTNETANMFDYIMVFSTRCTFPRSIWRSSK